MTNPSQHPASDAPVTLAVPAAISAEPRYVGERMELIQSIGAGGCASVWLARHRETGALLAAKLVHGGEAMDEVALRFQREAELSARLSHRNLVRVHDFFREPDGQPVLLMEYLRGQTLEDRLQEWGPLPCNTAVAIFVAVLRGLEHAHELGVIHRDLKPANVFLSVEPDGVVIPKLLDFGIAKTTEQQSIALTQNGQVLGSPAYMSPEQVRGSAVGPASDIFSAGAMFFEMLTGKLAFNAPSAHGAMAAVLERDVTPPSSIPVELWPIVEKALRKNPEERFGSIRAMRVALEETVEYTEATGTEALAALELELPPIPELPPMPASSSRPPPPATIVTTMVPALAPERSPQDSTGEYSAGISTTAAPEALPLREKKHWRYAALAAAALTAWAGFVVISPTRAEAAGTPRIVQRVFAKSVTVAPTESAAQRKLPAPRTKLSPAPSVTAEPEPTAAPDVPKAAPKKRKPVARTPGF